MIFATSAGRRLPAASRPRSLRGLLAAAVGLAFAMAAPGAAAQDAQGFRRFVTDLWPEAQSHGISRATFDKAFAGVDPDFSIPDLVLPDTAGRPYPLRQHVGHSSLVLFFIIRNGTPG